MFYICRYNKKVVHIFKIIYLNVYIFYIHFYIQEYIYSMKIYNIFFK